MENRSLRIFIACAIGAGIGSMVALELNHYFWWLGVFLGGFVGYVAYEFKKVLVAIPRAWRTVTRWRITKESALEGLMAIVETFIFFLSVSTPYLVISNIFTESELKNNVSKLFFVIGPMIVLGGLMKSVSKFNEFDDSMDRLKKITKYCNPFTLYLYFPVWTIFYFFKKLPKIIALAGRFLKTILLLIHSDIRLLCGIDAAIGAAVGYFTGDVIIGTITGGVFGVINYKIVSQMILNLNLSKA